MAGRAGVWNEGLALFYAIARAETNPIAHRLMNRNDSLADVLEADPRDPHSAEGVGAQVAAFLSQLPKLTPRYLADRAQHGGPFVGHSLTCQPSLR